MLRFTNRLPAVALAAVICLIGIFLLFAIALPARTAWLEGGPGLPPYRSVPAERPEDLERALRDHLEAGRAGLEHRHTEIPAGLREQLRALGYAEGD